MSTTTTQTRERGIIFTGESVRQIIAGTKHMTRRVVQPQPHESPERGDGVWMRHVRGGTYAINQRREVVTNKTTGRTTSREFTVPVEEWLAEASPYRPGDHLWVRERWRATGNGQLLRAGKIVDQPHDRDQVVYAADEATDPGPWRSPLFMPRSASRLTLQVTAVRVERLNDISNDDAAAEGCVGDFDGNEGKASYEVFRQRWDAINGKKAGRRWEDSPWVWVLAFAVVKDGAK